MCLNKLRCAVHVDLRRSIRSFTKTNSTALYGVRVSWRANHPSGTRTLNSTSRGKEPSPSATRNQQLGIMSARPLTDTQLSSLLNTHSTDQYYVEYSGFLSNHLAHGIIALHRLGANQQQLEAFTVDYSRRLESVGGTTHSQQKGDEQEGIPDLLGMRVCFYKILRHFQGLFDGKYGKSIENMVRGEFPGLYLGVAGSALHGLIHTGYGVAARNPRVVCEGLAYIHHSYLPLALSDKAPALTSWGQGSSDVLDVVSKVRTDTELREYMLQESSADWIVQKKLGSFQNRMVALLSGKGDKIAQYVHQIKFPEFYKPSSKNNEQLEPLMKWLVECIINIYQLAENRNDFFLLHGVTSSWALTKTLPLLHDYDVALDSLRTQFCILMAVYVAQGSPALVIRHLTEPDVSALSWQDLRSRVLQMPSDTDEHVIKLVQVCDDMSKVNTDVRMSDVYKRAALTAMTYPLFFQ